LVYEAHVVDDDASTSDGNGDGIVECGETIEVNVILRNQGAETATGVAATLSTGDAYITITDSIESFPDIAGGETEQDLDDYDFHVAGNTPNEHVIHFGLDITASSGGPWADSFDIRVYCASPAPDGFQVHIPVVVRGAD
jgi:hypothetical protein